MQRLAAVAGSTNRSCVFVQCCLPNYRWSVLKGTADKSRDGRLQFGGTVVVGVDHVQVGGCRGKAWLSMSLYISHLYCIASLAMYIAGGLVGIVLLAMPACMSAGQLRDVLRCCLCMSRWARAAATGYLSWKSCKQDVVLAPAMAIGPAMQASG